MPHDTQAPIEIGETFTYKVQFPDAGFYWYHPHIREDFGLEMGLYGTIIVEPTDTDYWPAADRQLTITLDDLLVEDGHIASFDKAGPNFTAMGRFGNVMLINGEPSFAGEAAPGEVVRLYLVNTANTRIFNVAIPGARTKLVGSDSGRYEHEALVDEVLLAPSERAVVDVLFDAPGDVRAGASNTRPYLRSGCVHRRRRPDQRVPRPPSRRSAWTPELSAEHRSIQPDLERPPDKVLAFFSRMPLLYGEGTPTSYACPMHPDVTSMEPGTCPKCGMTLAPVFAPDAPATSYVCPMHPEVTASEPGTCPECGMKLVPSEAAPEPTAGTHPVTGHGEHGHGDGLEWEDLMPEINRASDSSNMIWQLIDRETGAENGAISWDFTVGDRVKIRLVNEMDADHPMHHPFHIHGAGRFLVLSRDDEPEANLVWKDTVLVRSGETVDILLDVSNPGLWMAHCHIAEHNQSGMMFSFNVARPPESVAGVTTKSRTLGTRCGPRSSWGIVFGVIQAAVAARLLVARSARPSTR